MRRRLKLVRNLAIASGIVVALGFGASDTSGCIECDPPPNESCDEYVDPDLYCEHWCVNVQGCEFGGECGRQDFCECLEK